MRRFGDLVMKISKFLALILALVFTATPVFAGEFAQITKQKYNKLLPGHSITGEYRYMRERTKTYRFKELHNADGSTNYEEGDIKAKGQWFTVGEQKICYKYPDHPEMGGGTSCFWVYLSEGCYYGYGITEMSINGPRAFEDWSARWVIEGSGQTCAAPVG